MFLDKTDFPGSRLLRGKVYFVLAAELATQTLMSEVYFQLSSHLASCDWFDMFKSGF